jgi:hypothetical protein
MTGTDPAVRSRLERLGPIRRARGYRLYDHRGRRYLDLWQSGGRALLGHRPDRSLARIKGALSRGVNGGLPSVYERRLRGRLQQCFAGFEPLLTGGDAEVRLVLQHLGIGAEELHDPALDTGPAQARVAGIWRPFAGPTPPPANWRAVVPVLPSTIGQAPAPVCLPRGAVPGELAALLAPAPQPAALLLAGLAGLDRLPRYGGAVWAQDAWPDPDGCAGWERRGPYVAARCDAAAYDAVFDRFLRAGVLLSPSHPGPSILPDEVSAGEAATLMRLFASEASAAPAATGTETG